MPTLQIPRVMYLGGFSHVQQSKSVRQGRLVLDDDAVTLDRVQDSQMRNFPDFELCRTRAIATIEVTSEQAAKSRVGAVLAFGVLGLGAKATMDRATLIVTLESGETGYLAMNKESAASVLGHITPWAREQGIALGAPQAEPIQSVAPNLIADELIKLAQLRDSGVLSEDELALKSKLIEDHMGTSP